MDLRDLRQNYDKFSLHEDQLADDPIVQFRAWMSDAKSSELLEPNAFSLSTVDSDGFPASRVVLLKEIDEDGFIFYTNYDSDKGSELHINPKASLNFMWLPLQRQVRINGIVEKVSRERSENYFHGRPRGSQIGAWVSNQSEIISDRSSLEQKLQDMTEKFADVEVIPTPPYWGGYKVYPTYVEFWQGRESRLHDRLRYIKDEDHQWQVIRLSP